MAPKNHTVLKALAEQDLKLPSKEELAKRGLVERGARPAGKGKPHATGKGCGSTSGDGLQLRVSLIYHDGLALGQSRKDEDFHLDSILTDVVVRAPFPP